MDRSGGDWRALLQPEARSRIVNKIKESLMKHIPVSVPDGLNDLEQIAARIEDKIYAVATNQSDYLRKLSLKMLSMETSAQQAAGNAQAIPNQNNSASGLPPQGSNQAQTSAIPLMSQQQAQHPNTSSSAQASSLGSRTPGRRPRTARRRGLRDRRRAREGVAVSLGCSGSEETAGGRGSVPPWVRSEEEEPVQEMETRNEKQNGKVLDC